jgi:RNA polymerase sigma-70 factor (ECF subfamily)
MITNDQAMQKALVVRCQHGESRAMEELFLLHNRALGYYLCRMLSRDDVTDVQQEVWLTVLRRLRKLREPGAFVVWLYQIARSKAIGQLKERRPTMMDDTEVAAQGIDDDSPDFTFEDAAKIHEELTQLSETHREVLLLRFMEDLSYDQIAEIIGSSVGTVRSRLHYAKAALRKRLEMNNE